MMNWFKSSDLFQDSFPLGDFLDPDFKEIRVTEFNERVEVDLVRPEQRRVLLQRQPTQDDVDVFDVFTLLGDVVVTISDVILTISDVILMTSDVTRAKAFSPAVVAIA